jgi:UDP-N-acetylmuramyl pentapeptide phosphotransferase/UDP-N-acetylglucosamine-1-phosphate transferase
MKTQAKKRNAEALGETQLPAHADRLWRHQTPSVRFWIITMMLVLVGLSTLKLR